MTYKFAVCLHAPSIATHRIMLASQPSVSGYGWSSKPVKPVEYVRQAPYLGRMKPRSMFLVERMKQRKRLLGHKAAIYCIIFDKTFDHFFTGSDDYLVKVPLCFPKPRRPHNFPGFRVVVFDTCSRRHANNPNPTQTPPYPSLCLSSRNVWHLAWQSSKRPTFSTFPFFPQMWRLSDGQLIHSFRGHKGDIVDLSINRYQRCTHA